MSKIQLLCVYESKKAYIIIQKYFQGNIPLPPPAPICPYPTLTLNHHLPPLSQLYTFPIVSSIKTKGGPVRGGNPPCRYRTTTAPGTCTEHWGAG